MKEPCYILLDIDGVLNRHGQNRHTNGYNGIEPECVEHFNTILEAVPEAKIVIISSWRYDVHSGRMTVAGIEAQLLTHGVNCSGRVCDVTEPDADICGNIRSWEWLRKNGGVVRRVQIWRWLYGSLGHMDVIGPDPTDRRWCILDDMSLGLLPEFAGLHIKTDPKIGLTASEAERAITLLRAEGVQYASR